MQFDISALPADLKGGLSELKCDYDFSLSGKTVLTVAVGQTAQIAKTDDGFNISYTKKCEFYRQFIRLLSGEFERQESCAFSRLSVMIDCSRNAVPSVEAVKALIRKLAVMGYGAIELYTEDTYQIDGEQFFGYFRGRYSAGEIREIDGYASLFGLELIPCIQTLAHLNGITRWGRFKPIIDCNDILLADDGRTYELIDKMFCSLSENFSSRRVHIGMDEAHMVGLGKYLEEHGFTDRFAVMQKHLKRVLEIAERHGFECTMWSDMFFRLANNGKYEHTDGLNIDSVKSIIPPNVTLEYWDYYRNDIKEYEGMLSAHKALSEKTAFACGAWRWNSFLPSNTMSINRNKIALQACKKYGVSSVKVTLWGDDGGECSTFSTLPALVATAEFAYGNDEYENAFSVVTGAKLSDFCALEIADNPLNSDSKFYGGNFTKIFLYNDLLCGIYDYCAKPQYRQSYLNAAKMCKAAAKSNKKYSCLFDTAAALSLLIAEKYDFGVRLRAAYQKGDREQLRALSEKIKELVKLLDKFYTALQRQWYSENKPFGFEVQDIRLGGLRQRFLHCRKIICGYVNGKSDSIEELEETVIKCDDFFDTVELRCDDRWRQIASVNRL